jgi:Transmembrane exosortase (Exosortase_EpsH)
MDTSIRSVAPSPVVELAGAAGSSFDKQQRVADSDVVSADRAASRAAVFRWAVVILAANQLLAIVKGSAPITPLDTLTSLLSVGLFQYMAWYVVFRLLGAGQRNKAASNCDWGVALGLCLTVFLPTPQTVWFAATALGVYLILTPDGDSKLRSAGIVLLALSVQEFWGHQLFEVIASPLLRAETAAVGTILQTVQPGADWHDNIITSQNGWGIVVYPYCSSFHNVSLAILCWVTISRQARDTWRWRDCASAGLIVAAMISINMARLLLMSLNKNVYHYWHDGTGNQIFAIAASLFVLLASLFAVRRIGERG